MHTRIRISHFDCTFKEMKSVCYKHSLDPIITEDDEGETYAENWVAMRIGDIEHSWFLDDDYEDEWNEFWREDYWSEKQ